MNLPENIPMRPTSFMDGAKGWAMQTYVNDEFGVTLVKERAEHGQPFVSTLALKALPDKTFNTYAELREAAKDVK